MANFKRRRSRRQVRCTMCTRDRWLGNHKARLAHGTRRRQGALRTRRPGNAVAA